MSSYRIQRRREVIANIEADVIVLALQRIETHVVLFLPFRISRVRHFRRLSHHWPTLKPGHTQRRQAVVPARSSAIWVEVQCVAKDGCIGGHTGGIRGTGVGRRSGVDMVMEVTEPYLGKRGYLWKRVAVGRGGTESIAYSP